MGDSESMQKCEQTAAAEEEQLLEEMLLGNFVLLHFGFILAVFEPHRCLPSSPT